jgi:AraC-like DNA-binding protein
MTVATAAVAANDRRARVRWPVPQGAFVQAHLCFQYPESNQPIVGGDPYWIDTHQREQVPLNTPSSERRPRAPRQFATDAFPEQDRSSLWGDEFGRRLVRLDLRSLPDRPLRSTTALYAPPTLTISLNQTTGHHSARTRALLTDSNDKVVLLINLDGTSVLSQLNRHIVIAPGEAACASCADVATLSFAMPGRFLCLSMARQSLVAFDVDPDELIMKHIAKDSHALRLLVSYATAVLNSEPPGADVSKHLYADHVYDLVRLMVGSSHSGAHSLRAARHSAVMREIDRHFLRPGYSLTELAREIGVTTRYIQLLLADSGTSFVDATLERRLKHAHDILSTSERRNFNIADIARQSGFSTASHFHRMFRRKYGITPGEVRPRSRDKTGD